MGRACFCIYISLNMAVCAVVFAPWALPRETVSGLMGRWASTERGWRRVVGRLGTLLIDNLHWWEPDHCNVTYRLENVMRKGLYQ